jgi:hypothetical protein
VGELAEKDAVVFDATRGRVAVAHREASGAIVFTMLDMPNGTVERALQLAPTSHGPPQLAWNAQSGQYLVMWKRSSDVLVGRMVVGEALGATFEIASNLSGNDSYKSIGVAADAVHGRFLVAYLGNEPGASERYALLGRFYDSTGRALAAAPSAFILSNTDEVAGLFGGSQVDLVYHPDLDAYAVAYQVANSQQIETLLLAHQSTTPGRPIVHDLGRELDRRVRLVVSRSLEHQAILLLYGQRASPSGFDLFGRRLGSALQPIGGDFKINGPRAQTVADVHGFQVPPADDYPANLRGKFFLSWGSSYQYLNADTSRAANSVPDRIVTAYPRWFALWGDRGGTPVTGGSTFDASSGGLTYCTSTGGALACRSILPDASPL